MVTQDGTTFVDSWRKGKRIQKDEIEIKKPTQQEE